MGTCDASIDGRATRDSPSDGDEQSLVWWKTVIISYVPRPSGSLFISVDDAMREGLYALVHDGGCCGVERVRWQAQGCQARGWRG